MIFVNPSIHTLYPWRAGKSVQLRPLLVVFKTTEGRKTRGEELCLQVHATGARATETPP
jgi:hypothetical protein